MGNVLIVLCIMVNLINNTSGKGITIQAKRKFPNIAEILGMSQIKLSITVMY